MIEKQEIMMRIFPFKDILSDFESYLNGYITSKNYLSDELKNACIYSVQSGGKRLRPLILILITKKLGKDIKEIYNLGISLELIHEFSLIHDDMECMDNDDYRRGMLTVHKKYGEDIALLSGDALLNMSFENAINELQINNDLNTIKAYKYLFECSGHMGMIGGQSLECETSTQDLNTYFNIILNKTAKLIMAATTCPALYFNCEDGICKKLNDLGKYMGLLFQIIDDRSDGDGIYKINKTKADEFIIYYKNEIHNIIDELRNAGYDTSELNGLILYLFDEEYEN